ncbi:hypothetical protein [Methylosinus sp. RM1]|uniref:hypothetical protein n=1 Tax=Methylosinus sp. RM1 TaxID=2583817 RepID=UPI00140B6FD2|nr:hypothetical protein [Methylosinus sp. RM1]
MAVFAIIAQKNANAENLPSAIATQFPDDHLQLGNGVWLVAAKRTAKEVSDTLGVTDGSNGNAVIIEASTYYGRAGNNIWAWIKDKWEATING